MSYDKECQWGETCVLDGPTARRGTLMSKPPFGSFSPRRAGSLWGSRPVSQSHTVFRMAWRTLQKEGKTKYFWMRRFYFVSSAKRKTHLGLYLSTNEPKMRMCINGGSCKNHNISIHYVNKCSLKHNLITDELNMVNKLTLSRKLFRQTGFTWAGWPDIWSNSLPINLSIFNYYFFVHLRQRSSSQSNY